MSKQPNTFLEWHDEHAVTATEETQAYSIQLFEISSNPVKVRIDNIYLNNATRQWMSAEVGYRDKIGKYHPLDCDSITPQKPLTLKKATTVYARYLYYKINNILTAENIIFHATLEVLT